MSTAAVIIGIQNKIIRTFYSAGATSPKKATTREQLQLRHKFIFDGLVRKGVIVAVADNKFYLDVARAEEFKKQRRKTLLIVMFVVVLGLVITLIINNV